MDKYVDLFFWIWDCTRLPSPPPFLNNCKKYQLKTWLTIRWYNPEITLRCHQNRLKPNFPPADYLIHLLGTIFFSSQLRLWMVLVNRLFTIPSLFKGIINPYIEVSGMRWSMSYSLCLDRFTCRDAGPLVKQLSATTIIHIVANNQVYLILFGVV